MTIEITGRVIDRQARRSVPGVLVEAWVVNPSTDEPVGGAQTDGEGVFRMELEEDRLRDLFLDQPPEVFFRVSSGDEPVASTEDSVVWRIGDPPAEIVIEVDLPPVEDLVRRVAGQVRGQEGSPVPAVIVRAFDQDLGIAEPLGEATTDEVGLYTIQYSIDQLNRIDKRSADLIVHVFSPDSENTLLGVSDTVFDAPADAQVDVTIELPFVPETSEYEQILAKLAPLLGDREPQDLSDEEITSLAEKAGIGRSHLAILVQSAKLAQETDLPIEVFYGLVRHDLPPSLDRLLARAPDALRTALESAVEQRIIPAIVGEDIETILRRFERLRGVRTPLDQLAPDLGLDGSLPLFAHLADRGIRSLLDIRSAGGIGHLADLPVAADDQAVWVLEAHARLSLLSTNLSTNARFVEAGYASLDDIAETPRETFVTTLENMVDTDTATMVHAAASVQSRYLGNVLSDLRINRANGGASIISAPLEAAIPQVCSCEDCNNASSPMAYLADLLDYAVRHLKKIISTNGLKGQYFDGVNFTNLRMTRTDTAVDFDWGTGSPNPSVQPDAFSVRWTGWVAPRYSEMYAFHIASDDKVQGVNLWVNDQLVIDKRSWSNQAQTEKYGQIPLTADRKYSIKLEYVESGGGANVKLMWSSATQLKETVPSSRLYSDERTESIDLTFLEDRFHQPFRDLPATCELMEKQVRQVRICIEVLRKHFPASVARNTPQAILEQAYSMLLGQIGTSLDELRRARTLPEDRQRALMDRLGIFIPRQQRVADTLKDLLRDPTDPAQLTEEFLERWFGLRDTRRGPLDPDIEPQILVLRKRNLWRVRWWNEDWPEPPPADAHPLLDPDNIAPEDMVSATLTKNLPPFGHPTRRTPNTPIQFWEDRRDQIDDWLKQIRQVHADLQDPKKEIEAFITDRVFSVTDSRWVQLTVGLGVPIADFQRYRTMRLEGKDMAAELDPLKLSEAAFDYLVSIWEILNQNPPGQVLPSEWDEVHAILVQRLKQGKFADWRAEEKAKGFVLGPQYFRLRATPLSGGTEWHPKAWRSSLEVRERWEDTLRARIEQENAVRDGILAAVSAVEEVELGDVRDELLHTVTRPGELTQEKLAGFTQRLQIDFQAGACQMTTRIAQAIETIQGVLFGARNGLLEDNEIALDADDFDEEWKWIGSYATWRAAMQVFLYPENALRPTLRREKSKAFDKLIETLRDAVRVKPENAQKAADEYTEYLNDVCTLTPVAVYETGNWLSESAAVDSVARPYLVVARGASGKLYFAAFDRRPESGLSFVPGHTLWEEIEGLPANSEVVGFLPYQPKPGKVHIGLYARYKQSGSSSPESLHFASYDSSSWKMQPITELPTLVNSVEYRDGIIPADAMLTAAGIKGWRVRGDDRLVPMYVEGYGSQNRAAIMVIAATQEDDGRRRVGILRGRDGGLVLTSFNTIDGDWDLPAGKPVTLWSGGMQRLLVRKNEGSLTQIGLLGTGWPQDNAIQVLWSTSDGIVHAPSGAAGWPVNPQAVFIGADIDGDGRTELLAFEYEGNLEALTAETFVAVLIDQGGRLSFESRTALSTGTVHPRFNTPIEDHWAPRTSLRTATTQEDLVVLSKHKHPYTAPGETSVWVGVLRRNTQLPTRFEFVALYKGEQSLPGWSWQGDDDFLPVKLKVAAAPDLLVTSTSRPEMALLRREADGKGFTIKWQGSRIPTESTLVTDWTRQAGDFWVAATLPEGKGAQALVVVSRDGTQLGIIISRHDGSLGISRSLTRRIPFPGAHSSAGWLLIADARYIAADVDQDGHEELITLAQDGRLGVLRAVPPVKQEALLGLRNVRPVSVAARSIMDRNSRRWLSDRKAQIETAYDLNQSVSLRRYLDEAYYFVPMDIALRLRESGYYTEALDWLRSVYDYERPIPDRKIAYKLVLDEKSATKFERYPAWLRDPLDPHTIAETRQYSYAKFTILAIVRCLLDFADAEFTRATSESVPRARELYLEALDLLDLPEIKLHLTGCIDRIGELELEIGEDEYVWVWDEIYRRLTEIKNFALLISTVQNIKAIVTSNDPLPIRLAAAQEEAGEALETSRVAPSYAMLLEEDASAGRRAQIALLADPATELVAENLGNAASDAYRSEMDGHLIAGPGWNPSQSVGQISGSFQYVPAPKIPFCIPPNKLMQVARSHAELNLYKIRTCRNIAGMSMQLDPYAMPTAAEASLQSLGSGDRLPAFQAPTLQPLPYRYAVLIERTKQLVQLAQQIEASMLASLQSQDHEEYELIKARQDLALARAGVRLKDLQLTEAADGITLADMQRDRAQMQAKHYGDLLSAGLTLSEKLGIAHLAAAAASQHAAASAEWASLWTWSENAIVFSGAKGVAGALSSSASALSMTAQAFAQYSSFERREQDWRLQKGFGEQDVRIGLQQIRLAQDRVRVSAQDRAIAALQTEHAEAMVDFIDTKKFGKPALYEWMSGVLEQVYRFFLQQATSMAQLAEAQLAFERQEIPPAFIQVDYWEPPSENSPPASSPADVGGQTTNVRGLTGSARLLRNITELDQYAFRTDQRKLQLTETISLAQLDPFAFQRFRETGVLPFATPMSLFDRKFPGHYLRLIRRVRTSVIALIPPTQGIRATLATIGTSRAVIGSSVFQTVRIQRGPESVALTAPINATGLFELDPQPGMLDPFEGIGIDTTWEFRMPKAANPFDYRTIADVLITIEYTALDSFDYRQQVIQQLDPRTSADRAFSFRHHFADAWYDLNNPELLDEQEQMVVSFSTELEDFPPNIKDLETQNVVLYFAPGYGKASGKIEVTDLNVTLKQDDTKYAGGQATSDDDGVISTRRGSVTNWNTAFMGKDNAGTDNKAPVGTWELSLNYGDPVKDRKIRDQFKKEEIEDILFVITYSGRTSEWPI